MKDIPLEETTEYISTKQLSKKIWESLKDIRLKNNINENYINIIAENFNKQTIPSKTINEKEIEYLFYFMLFHEITQPKDSSHSKLIQFKDRDLYKIEAPMSNPYKHSTNNNTNNNNKDLMTNPYKHSTNNTNNNNHKDFDYLENEYDDYEKEIMEQHEQNQNKEKNKTIHTDNNNNSSNSNIPLLTKKEISTKCSNDPIYNQILSINLKDISKFEHILDKNTYDKLLIITDKTYTESFDFIIYKTTYYELHLVRKNSNTNTISFQRKFLNCSDASTKK